MPKDDDTIILTPELIRQAYRLGFFPMAAERHGEEIIWHDPPLRGVLPLDRFHVPRSLVKTIRRHPFLVTFDRDFSGVIRGCADARDETWINDEIIDVFTRLHTQGDAHSVEAWERDDAGRLVLVGGVYGLSLGGAFFGESMFSLKPNASRIALVFLAARLSRQGYGLFDAQFFNPHLVQFGLEEIKRRDYSQRLARALEKPCIFKTVYSAESSNDPGISCKVGTEPLPPETGAVGAMSALAGVVGSSSFAVSASDVAAGVSPAACAADVSAALSSAGWSSGAAAGACSLEYASDFAAVTVFLHSITQTS